MLLATSNAGTTPWAIFSLSLKPCVLAVCVIAMRTFAVICPRVLCHFMQFSASRRTSEGWIHLLRPFGNVPGEKPAALEEFPQPVRSQRKTNRITPEALIQRSAATSSSTWRMHETCARAGIGIVEDFCDKANKRESPHAS